MVWGGVSLKYAHRHKKCNFKIQTNYTPFRKSFSDPKQYYPSQGKIILKEQPQRLHEKSCLQCHLSVTEHRFSFLT